MDSKIPIIALISIFYITGLFGFYTGSQILYAFFICLFLIGFVAFNKIKPAFAFVLCLMFFLGYTNAKWQNKEYDSFSGLNSVNNLTLTGRVYSIPNVNNKTKTAKFFMGVYQAKFPVQNYPFSSKSRSEREFTPKNTKILVSIRDEFESYDKIKIGDIIEIRGNLRIPKPHTNPSEFDYKNYLKNKDTFSILYANKDYKRPFENKNSRFNPAQVDTESEDAIFKTISRPNIKTAKNKWKEIWWFSLQKLDITRDKIILKHSKYIKSPNLEVLGGIVFGDDAVNPPNEVKESFINSGLLHLLAASGLNVALIFSIWWALGGVLNFPYRAKILTGIGIVIVYTFMTGFPPSILRATIMLTLILVGKLMFKTADNLALVFFTGFTMLLFNPKLINDVGFELSFLVTGGLITCVEPICSKFKPQNLKFKEKIVKKIPKKLKMLRGFAYIFAPIPLLGMILVPLTAQMWAAPLQMYYFNTFTPMSVFANIAVLPFIGIISFTGFLSSIISPLPVLGDLFIKISSYILNPLISILLNISNYFSTLPFSIVKTPSPCAFQIILYYLIILTFILSVKKNFKKLSYNAVLGGMFLIFLCTFISVPNKNYEILAFDVGNADNFLIKTPKNKYIMIDTGKLPYKGVSGAKRITLEYLYDKNIRTIETLIITHFDTDHSGGTIDILENLKVKNVLVQRNTCDSENSCTILKYLKETGQNYRVAKDETVYFEKNLEIKTFTPKISGPDGHDNENSIMTLVSYHPKTRKTPNHALFTGDGGIKSINSIKKELPDGIKVLKVPHHGAKGVLNKEILQYLKPEYSIISTGKNQYGHPAPETIRLLEESNSKIFSTKDFGAIKFVFKGAEEEIYGYEASKNHTAKGKRTKITPKSEGEYHFDASLQIKL